MCKFFCIAFACVFVNMSTLTPFIFVDNYTDNRIIAKSCILKKKSRNARVNDIYNISDYEKLLKDKVIVNAYSPSDTSYIKSILEKRYKESVCDMLVVSFYIEDKEVGEKLIRAIFVDKRGYHNFIYNQDVSSKVLMFFNQSPLHVVFFDSDNYLDIINSDANSRIKISCCDIDELDEVAC